MRTDGFLSPYLVIKGLHLWMRCYNGTSPLKQCQTLTGEKEIEARMAFI